MSRPKVPPPAAHPRPATASREVRPSTPVASPAPVGPRAASRTFDDDPTRRPKSGTSFLRLQVVPTDAPGCELRAYVATPRFAGKSAAVFRDSDLKEFVAAARAFAARRDNVAALQGGVFGEHGGLLQVLVGIHIYHPGQNPGRAAARVVVASSTSDDLLTATLQSAPLLIGQFADQMAALADGARDSALLIGQ